MNPISLIALNTFRELMRNKLLYSVFAFALLLMVVSALFGSVTVGDRILIIKDFGLFALSLCGAVIVILSGVSLLDRELRQKTIYNVLSKPVSRLQFILGKYLGLVLTSTVLTSIMAIIFILFAASFEGEIDYRLFSATFLVLCEMLLLSAIAIFFSSLVVTTSLAGLFTFGAYLAGHSFEALNYFLYTKAEYSSPTLGLVARGLKLLLPDLTTFAVADLLLYGPGLSASYALMATLYAVIYSTVCLLLASAIFARRDFQ